MLRGRPAKESYEDLVELQKLLCEKRLIVTGEEKADDWTEKDIRNVLRSLKNNKARDPIGHVNEIYKVEGKDLARSLVIMMNNIKNQLKVPSVFRKKNINPLYKGKGSKAEIENERGVFNCTVLNCIMQKLIYKSNYEEIESNLTDSNCGARKNRNIRNNTFVLNAVLNEVNKNKKKAVEILIYDYWQCFDGLDVETTVNDLYEAGVTSDHLNLINPIPPVLTTFVALVL